MGSFFGAVGFGLFGVLSGVFGFGALWGRWVWSLWGLGTFRIWGHWSLKSLESLWGH